MTADPTAPPRAKPHVRFRSCPLGVLAEVVFVSGGGGAAIGRDQTHAETLAAEIVKDHGENRP